jgi:hypothetical protein
MGALPLGKEAGNSSVFQSVGDDNGCSLGRGEFVGVMSKSCRYSRRNPRGLHL